MQFCVNDYGISARSVFKIPKLKFAQELEVLIIKNIIEKCGGNPNKIDDILNTS